MAEVLEAVVAPEMYDYSQRIDKALLEIDTFLATLSCRSLVAVTELTDALLDIRSPLTNDNTSVTS